MPTRKVYVVVLEDTFIHDFYIEGVFRAKKNAQEFIANECAASGRNEGEYRIEKHVIR